MTKNIKESITVVEGVLESNWLNLRDIDEQDANDFEDHWYAIDIVPRLEKNFIINSEEERDEFLFALSGMQETMEGENIFRGDAYEKFSSLCVIENSLKDIKYFPFHLNVNDKINEWLEEIKIQVEENKND
jgi:hypothetical protein